MCDLCKARSRPLHHHPYVVCMFHLVLGTDQGCMDLIESITIGQLHTQLDAGLGDVTVAMISAIWKVHY